MIYKGVSYGEYGNCNYPDYIMLVGHNCKELRGLMLIKTRKILFEPSKEFYDYPYSTDLYHTADQLFSACIEYYEKIIKSKMRI
jgi:hypothetical protein